MPDAHPPTTAEPSHDTKALVRLTMVCNERCPFCNVPMEDFPSRPAPDAALEEALAAVRQAGGQTLTISGGEPTLLRARLLAWVRRARELLPLVELQTNAVLVDAAYAQELARAGLSSAFVSLLSDEPALHDALAGLPGAFPRTLAGIDALLDAGVAVTLNPVVAASTQDRLPEYLRFVAARLPRVRSVSLSAVQPHGRAAHDRALLPDYGRLAARVREAREIARHSGITLLNPYCGLPLCVGWEEDPQRSVEAARADTSAQGVENTGDKHQGPACRPCALRTRCGGAWHAVWERPDPGLRPPLRKAEPWAHGPADPGAQAVARAAAPTPAALAALAARPEPTRWLWVRGLDPDQVAGLRGPCTDLAVDWQPGERATLRALRRLAQLQAETPDPARVRVAVRWPAAAQPEEACLQTAALLAALGVDALRPAGLPPERLRRLRLALPDADLEAP